MLIATGDAMNKSSHTRRAIEATVCLLIAASIFVAVSGHGKNGTVHQKIISAIKIVGNISLDKPIIIQSTRQANGVVVVSFADLLSDTLTTPGHKPTKEFAKITFDQNTVNIEPPSYFLSEKYRDRENFMLCRIVVVACSYMLEHKEIGDEFELEVNKINNYYNVTATRIPYTPDSYVTIKVIEKSGNIKIM
jgi:hypothetical protein